MNLIKFDKSALIMKVKIWDNFQLFKMSWFLANNNHSIPKV